MANEMQTTGGANGGSPIGRMVKQGLIAGTAGAVYVVASDQLVDGWFQDTAGMDTSRSAPLYRALAQFAIALLLARVLWKYSKEAAVGCMVGGGVKAMVRVLDDANIAPRIRDLVDGDAGNGTPRTTRPWVASTSTPSTSTPARGLPGRSAAAPIHEHTGWQTMPADFMSSALRTG